MAKLYFIQYYISRKVNFQGSVCGLRILVTPKNRIGPDPQHRRKLSWRHAEMRSREELI